MEPLKLCRVVGFKGGQEVIVVTVMMMMRILTMEGFNEDVEDYDIMILEVVTG